MRAIVRNGKVELTTRATPVLGPDEVLVEVKRAGICRTDVYVADGTLAVEEPRVLGHEAGGVVASEHPRFPRGARVAIDPVPPSTDPPKAARRDGWSMLGVDRDGAFADFVAVPAHATHRVPHDLPWEAVAMAEPVAAALGVLRAPIDKRARGAVHGAGRIADLVVRVLETAGFSPIRWTDAEAPRDLDWVVETRPDALSDLMRALRPGGTLVLKSRPPAPVALDVALAVRREITLVARSYGSFDDAVSWLATRRVRVDDLVGETYPLERFEAAFDAARRSERQKIFLSMER